MKKYLSLLCLLTVLPMSANAVESPVFDDRVPLSEKLLREYKTENPNVVFRDRNKAQRIGRWYMGLNADLSFYSGKYTQSNDVSIPATTENYRFKPVLGLDVTAGYRMNEKWRFDGAVGYMGKYFESEMDYDSGLPLKTDLSLETFYMTANAYYDIAYGIYAGLGFGGAFVTMIVDDTIAGKESKTNISPMGVGVIGWTYMLDEKVDFDFHYRFALYNGGKLTIAGATFDAGTIINNSLSAGIRYHF